MGPKRLSVRMVSGLVVCAAITWSAPAAWSQRDGERSGDRVQPPTELLEEYPFRQGELRSREERSPARPPDADSPQLPLSEPAEDRDQQIIWLIFGAAATLLLLGLIGRRVTRKAARDERDVPQPPPPQVSPPAAPRSSASAAPDFSSGREGPGPKNCYAVVNQKGGVGKTTVSLVLSAAAVRRGRRVLLLDLDPQASATSVLGADVDERPTVTDAMLSVECPLSQAVRPTGWGLDLAPADRLLRQADGGISPDDAAVLPRQLETVDDYDLLLIDCPPSLGGLTINALAAASRALVVTEPTFLALHAMEELLDTLRDVSEAQNPSLQLAGVVLNRVETTAEHKNSVAEVEDTFGGQLWEPHIPKRAILQDAMRLGVPPQDLETHSHYATEIAEIFDLLAMRIEAIEAKS